MSTPEVLQEEADAVAVEIEAAVAEVAQVEAAIEEGADVPFDRVPKLEHRLRLLRTRLRGLGRRRAEAATDRRLVELEQLRVEIEEGAVGHAQAIAQTARVAYEALVPFFAAVRDFEQWRGARLQELRDHRVPAWGGAAAPSPQHAGLGVSGDRIALGRLRVSGLEGAVVADELSRVIREFGEYGPRPVEEVPFLAGLAGRVVHEATELPVDTRYFQNRETGGWFTFSGEYAERSPNSLLNLDERTREEWVEEQWRSAS